ncbi:hypothetical protein Mal4_45770 [Maioricimonas rarisocia]|uniref:Uncharacterized protein n=1 Tax=Maioricimonas rarisocia TaxID=2528026 RepID=A0A517ZCP4_9PLAN|nr:hypothetical protein [Maioricimonas rarisocia]QDU40221.1 hypothetical protein Mal4_45770 [Maioricimonas rarisocia]
MFNDDKSSAQTMSRRTLLLWPAAVLAASGCGLSGRLFRRRHCEEEVFTAPAQMAPYAGPRMRLAVIVRSEMVPPEFSFPEAEFVRTLTVALQETGRFEVAQVIDPREFPEVLPCAAEAPYAPVGPWPGGLPPGGPIDSRLIIDVIEYRPYRPMQLHARVRLIDARGDEVAGFDRTWYGPKDVEPIRRLHPRRLRYPPPPAREEAAVTTNSPQHLLDVASRESAGVLATSVPPPDFPETMLPQVGNPELLEPPGLEPPLIEPPAAEYPLPAPPAWESPDAS